MCWVFVGLRIAGRYVPYGSLTSKKLLFIVKRCPTLLNAAAVYLAGVYTTGDVWRPVRT